MSEIEHGSFTPLVVSISDGMGKAAIMMYSTPGSLTECKVEFPIFFDDGLAPVLFGVLPWSLC